MKNRSRKTTHRALKFSYKLFSHFVVLYASKSYNIGIDFEITDRHNIFNNIYNYYIHNR